jgi:hypothetical protein
MDNYSYAMGYGFWCGKKCAERKQAAGIPPLGARKAQKGQEAEADKILAQAALERVRKEEEKGWSPLAVTGVVVGSLLGIALMVVIIKKAKNND